MNIARVLSQEDLDHQRRLCFAAGFLAGLFVALVAIVLVWHLRLENARLVSGRPAIVSQTVTQTTATVPTLRYGFPRDCMVMIDHRGGAWAVSC